MPVIIAPDGACYGRELSIALYDELDARVDQHIASLQPLTGVGHTPQILDLAGATGYRAGQLTELGAEVVVIDKCDNQAAIDRRNLSKGNKAAIAFMQADAAVLTENTVPQTDWALIHARRLLHWLPWQESEYLISTTLPRLAGGQTHIALCFHDARAPEADSIQYLKSPFNNFYRHSGEKVVGLMTKCGYEIIAHGSEALQSKRNYAIFARLPHPSPLKN